MLNRVKKAIQDGWSNVLSGFGGRQDKRNGFIFNGVPRLTHAYRNELYRSDLLFQKIINLLPSHALKNCLEFDGENEEALEDLYENLKVYQNLKIAWQHARLQSGGVWYLKIDDGQEPDMEVNYGNIKSINSGGVFSSEFIYPEADEYGVVNAITAQWFKLSGYSNGISELRIHRSRLIIFDGIETGLSNRLNNFGWGECLTDALNDPIRNYNIAHDIPIILLQDFAQGVYKFNGLNEQLSSTDGEKVVMKRLELMDLSSSVVNAKVLDKEDDFQRQTTVVTGIEKLIEQPERKLCALTNMPHTLLLGESPGASLSQSGTSQQTNWNDYVEAERNTILTPNINKLNYLIQMILKLPDRITFEYESLYQPTDREEAETKKLKAETKLIKAKTAETYISNQVISPQEIAQELMQDDDYKNIMDIASRSALNTVTENSLDVI